MENGRHGESEEYKRLLKFIEMKNAEPCPYEVSYRGGETRGGKRMPVGIIWHNSKRHSIFDYFEAATITVDRSYLDNMFYHILPKGRSANRYPCLRDGFRSRFDSFLRVLGVEGGTLARLREDLTDMSQVLELISSDPNLSPQEEGFIGVFRSLNCQGQRELLFCIDIRISRYFLLTLNDPCFKLLIESLSVNCLVSVLGKFLPTIYGNKFDIARGLVVDMFLGMSESDFKSSYSYAFREEARSYGEWGDVMDEILTKRRSKETASEIPKEDPDFCNEVSCKDNLHSLLYRGKAYCLESGCLTELGAGVHEPEGSID